MANYYAQLFAAETGHRLSVVVQGGVSAETIVQTANHCRHWRDLFPEAELILSLSSVDIILGTASDGDPVGLRLERGGGFAGTALEVIKSVCDKVVQAHGGLPLPAIKTDSPGLNNVNLQIAAAKAGLALATGTHILRTRSDLIFADDGFIGQWLDGNTLPRGETAALQQRVLISYLYTLNPYSYERMPFHYSDWFHFGLASDVKNLWNVPFMKLAQSTHYKYNPCADHSNHQERRMLTRLAVEQHVVYLAMQKYFPDLKLHYHNDLTDVRRSVDILCDNFIVCDLVVAKCLFEKYVRDFANPLKRLHCIPADDWALLAGLPASEREAILIERARIADNPALASFPRHYPAITLSTQIGEHAHGAVMAIGRAGLLIHGPYDTLPRGAFTALIDLRRFDGKGLLDLSVTIDGGEQVLARHRVALCDMRDELIAIDFDVHDDEARLFEIVVNAPGAPLIVIGGVTVQHRKIGKASAFSMQLSAAQHPFKSKVGVVKRGMLYTTGSSGRLLFGPYIALVRGSYSLRIMMPESRSAGHSHIEILGAGGNRPIVHHRIGGADLAVGVIELSFFLRHDVSDVQFRITTNQHAEFALGQVHVVSLSDSVAFIDVARQIIVSKINPIIHALHGLVEVK